MGHFSMEKSLNPGSVLSGNQHLAETALPRVGGHGAGRLLHDIAQAMLGIDVMVAGEDVAIVLDG